MSVRSFLLASSSVALLAACSNASTPEVIDPDLPDLTEVEGPAHVTNVTATLKAAPGRTLGRFAAASAGDAGAIAYAEMDEAGQSRVLLQRLDAKGAVSGAPVELDAAKGEEISAVTAVTNGVRYIACWQRGGTVSCAGAPVGEGPVVAGLSVKGARPALVYGTGTFTLAYGAPGHIDVVRLAGDGSMVGKPASIDMGEVADPRVYLAATESGFALLDADESSNVHARLLDASMATVEGPIELDQLFWGHVSVAAQGARVAMAVTCPYGARLYTLDDGALTHNHYLEGGGKLGMPVSMLASDASFDLLAVNNDPQGYDNYGVEYSTLQGDEVSASSVALPLEHRLEIPIAPLRLHGALFVAGVDGQPDEIAIVRVDKQ